MRTNVAFSLLIACSLLVPQWAWPQLAPSASTLPAAQPLPALTLNPAVLAPDNALTVSVPTSLGIANRIRLAVFERLRPAQLAEMAVNLTTTANGLQAAVHLQADPGNYELRLFSDDREHKPLTDVGEVIVPGLNRLPGWLLLNGSPLANTNAWRDDPAMPLFVTGWKRQLDRHTKFKSHAIRVASATPLQWRTLPLPPLTQLIAKDFASSSLQGQIRAELQNAQAGSQRGYLGFTLPIDDVHGAAAADISRAITNLRTALESAVPDVALIAQVDADKEIPNIEQVLSAVAPLCDAVLINSPQSVNSGRAAWLVKVARKIAEEQTDYDLPVIVLSPNDVDGDLDEVDRLMSGATGFIDQLNNAHWPGIVQRNAALFMGSVTLEDIGLLPDNVPSEEPYHLLRVAGRIPQLARTTNSHGVPEPDAIWVPNAFRIDAAMVQQLRASASVGSRIYIEGIPPHDDKGLFDDRWKALIGAHDVQVSGPQVAEMRLDDPWMFGSSRGMKLGVVPFAKITLEPRKVSSVIKTQRGRDVLVEPRAVASFSDGSPAVIVNPVGKGQVIWSPIRIPVIRLSFQPSDPSHPDLYHSFISTPQGLFYSAIAGSMAPALVVGKDQTPNASDQVWFALRRSARGALLLEVLNPGRNVVTEKVAVPTIAGVAFDLGDEKELPVSSRGFRSETTVTIPAHGWKLIAFAATRKALDEERDAPLLAARLRP